VEGFYHYYFYKISLAFDSIPTKASSGQNQLIWGENGFVETTQIIFIFFSIIFFSIFLKKNNFNLKLFDKLYLYLYILGLFYFFFEEISWGQHFFHWETPTFFSDINHQNETNLHNTSNLFNELPRSLLTLWCIFPFILIKFLKNIDNNSYVIYFIYPSEKLKKISILILMFYVPDFIFDKLNIYPNPSEPIGEHFKTTDIKSREIVDLITFNFLRLSELIELLFCFYILNHAYYFLKKLENFQLK
tara:strand:- start:346 stop:1083 length:738 start_codon:yes stop_codon:yes gene_type:complete